jgi:DnaJ homolog subfamily C member 11
MSVIRRETEETLSLLKETAKNRMQAESLKGGKFLCFPLRLKGPKYLRLGLLILEALYGPTEQDNETKDLVMDVTVAVQALVRNSQIHITGLRTKVSRILEVFFDMLLTNVPSQSGIQGFYDPSPTLSKSLRIRYTFQGRMHYAEIPDYVPVVLPLEGAFSCM